MLTYKLPIEEKFVETKCYLYKASWNYVTSCQNKFTGI